LAAFTKMHQQLLDFRPLYNTKNTNSRSLKKNNTRTVAALPRYARFFGGNLKNGLHRA